MRDYLFRGKRIDNGEWVEGCFLDKNNIGIFHDDAEESDCTIHVFSVIPETIGQYIGKTDKNGKKIFEGDVIQNELSRFVIKYGAYIPSGYCKEIFNCFETIGFYAFDGKREYQLDNYTKTIEVIGNIHDNPELLKGSEEKMIDKMRFEKAIDCIDDVLYSDVNYDETIDYKLTSYDFDWLKEAKEALEKQIPKKVKRTFKNGYDLVYCPRCGFGFAQYGLPFCGDCGQALDWSERMAEYNEIVERRI